VSTHSHGHIQDCRQASLVTQFAVTQIVDPTPLQPLTERNIFHILSQGSEIKQKVILHIHNLSADTELERFRSASSLYIEASTLANDFTREATNGDYLDASPALALVLSALYTLCKHYSRAGCQEDKVLLSSQAAIEMRSQALDGIKTVSSSIVEFAASLDALVSVPQVLNRASPIIMDPLYLAATQCAAHIKEKGDVESREALGTLRNCLRKLGGRWRNATEYLTILEAQEVSVGHKTWHDMFGDKILGPQTNYAPVHTYGWKHCMSPRCEVFTTIRMISSSSMHTEYRYSNSRHEV